MPKWCLWRRGPKLWGETGNDFLCNGKHKKRSNVTVVCL